jgi:hypothetical protein
VYTGDQVLDVRDLAREDDVVARQSQRFGELGAANRGAHERLAHHVERRPSGLGDRAFSSIRFASRSWSRLPPVDADAHRLAVVDCPLDHHGELRIVPGALADVAGIDAVLGERAGRSREVGQKLVPVEVEVPDQRHLAVHRVEAARGSRGRRRRPRRY